MKKLAVLIALLTAAALILEGCTSNDYVQGVTKTEIVIGNCVPVSGEYEYPGKSYNAGLTAYIKRINNEDGISGRKIRFIHYDSASDAGKALELTQKLIKNDKIFALCGQIGDSSIKATEQTIKERGIPALYMASGISELYNENAHNKEKCYFPIHAIDITDGRLIEARLLQVTDAERIGVLYTNDDLGTSILNGFKRQLEKEQTGAAVTELKIDTQDDITTAVIKLKNQGAQAIVAACQNDRLAQIIKALIAENLSIPVFTSYKNATKDTLALIKNEYVNVSNKFSVYAGAWLVQNDDEILELFRNDMEAAGKSEYAGDTFAFCGWITAHIFCEGLNRVGEGELNWQTFIAALEAEPVKIPLAGYLDFSNGKRIGAESMALLKIDAECENWFIIKDMQRLDEIK